MKEILLQLASYNIWANQKLIECIQGLPAETILKEMPSSFTSLQATLLHMWDAESIWWQRMKLQEAVIAPSANFQGNTRELVTAFLHQNKLWETWLINASPAALDHVFMYLTTKREPFKMPIYQMVLHVFNHGTYHRGQLVNMLRQCGVQKIPQTDFVIWTRNKK